MRMTALILTVVAAMLLTAPASPQDRVNPSQKQPTQESAKTVIELRKERLAVLQELTAQLTRLYQNGRVEVDELLEARVRLVQAELEAAQKQSDRLALHQNLVDELKQYEKLAQSRMEAGRGMMSSVLKIKARRLEAEIQLEQAKDKTSDVKKGDGKQQKIMVATPLVKNVTITEQYVCQIQAQRHIKIRALQTGKIGEVPVKEGQAVKKGDLIFKIVPILYQAKLDGVLAETKIAELEFNNVKRLNEKGVVSIQEVQLHQSKLAKAQAKSELAKAELNLTEVRAPFDGLIDRLQEQQGGLIKEGETLTTLSDNSAMLVYFNVPEARYLEYIVRDKNKDQKVELVLANGKKFNQSGKISAIEAQFNNDRGSIPFRADFANPDRLLRHGMTGNVLLHQTLQGATVIPQRATFELQGKWYVYVVDKDDVAHRREIVVQHELDGDFVISGLGANDRIISGGVGQVRDGEKVKYE